MLFRSLDEYARAAGLSELLLLKIDTEGHDLQVLRGALELLQSKQIQYVQFEYNSAWIASRHFLKDAFDLLLPRGYFIGKIHKTFIERFIEWDYRLEWFEQTNFVAWIEHIDPLFPIEQRNDRRPIHGHHVEIIIHLGRAGRRLRRIAHHQSQVHSWPAGVRRMAGKRPGNLALAGAIR